MNATTEYADWDDIAVLGFTTTTSTALTTSTTTRQADGTWYYNLRTVDNAGNWSAPTAMGPFLIDTTAPVTTDNVPAGWSRSPVTVALIPTDAGVVAYTQYAVNGAAWSLYSGPFTVSAEGTSTLRYRSADAAGHVEATNTVSVRVDTVAPAVPTAVVPSAVSTSSIEITWDPSTDTVSGLAYYAVYRDGCARRRRRPTLSTPTTG